MREDKAIGMERLVGNILLIGVMLSVTFLILGETWHWARSGTAAFNYSLEKLSIAEFLKGELREVFAGHFRPRLFINAGLALLLMTPYARVVASFFYFFLVEKNRKYAFFTLIVATVLTYSLFGR